ncbi:MAG: hypothetical protein F6K41_00600 [Symploca sp. SIO3E6]|nr:hypothetical protein [Caldora sp. SIO3E6]
MTAVYLPTLLETEDSGQTYSVYERYYFQILTFDELTDDFKLVYGSKAALEKEYGLEPRAKAEEDTIEGNDYPFYPKQGTSEWNNKELRFIQPPYPYIPLSST